MARLEIHELPSARNCTYVLPASDFALGLKVGQGMAGAEMKTAAKLGVTGKEIDKLCGKVAAALGEGAARSRPVERSRRRRGAQSRRGGQEEGH